MITKRIGRDKSKEGCIADASRFQTRSEWAKKSGPMYEHARYAGWMNECCGHMISPKKRRYPQPAVITLDDCMNDAQKFRTRSEWSRSSTGKFYRFASAMGWIEICCEHMTSKRYKNAFTLEECIADAANYETKNQWSIKSKKVYLFARQSNWLEHCCKHMISLPRKNRAPVFTLDECRADAAKYTSRTDWAKKSGKFYAHARRRDWLEVCCEHMVPGHQKYTKYTLESCIADAAKYETKLEWRENSPGSYKKAHEKKWAHLCLSKRQINKTEITLEQCIASAAEFSSITAWSKEHGKLKNYAKRNKWLDIIFPVKMKGGRPKLT